MKRRIILVLCALAVLSAAGVFYFSRRTLWCGGRFYWIPREVSPSLYQVAADRDFTEKFKKYAGTEVAGWLKKMALDEILGQSRLRHLLKNAVEAGPSQYPELYKRVRTCAAILHMSPPRIFVIADPAIRAEVANPEAPLLVISSGMLEVLSAEEVHFMVGHQLGHIQCGHVLPKTVISGTIDLLRRYLPDKIAGLAVPASCIALLRWTKDAEISADRAGLICCQSERVSVQALMAMISGLSKESRRKFGSPDIESFIAQRHESEQKALLDLSALLGELGGSDGCHSYVGTRVLELRDYARSPEFRRLFK